MVAQNLENRIFEREERYQLIKETEQRAQVEQVDDAEIVVVAYGAAARIVRSAVKEARAKGIKAGLIRPITLWPFTTKAIEQVVTQGRVKAFLSVEFSTGQMVDDVRLVVNGRCPVSFFGHSGGVVPTPAEVLVAIERAQSGEEFRILPYQSKLTGGVS
jgi:2-oxoglutarate ferredoxin oxidoreductase subunit alpha